MSLDLIASDEHFAYLGAGDQRGNVAAERIELTRLPEAVREQVIFWRDHLNEARFGVVNVNDTEACPRDGYGPGTRLNDRFERKAHELTVAGREVSVSTLYRKDARFRDQGIAGLVDRTKIKASGGPRVPPAFEEATQRVIAESLGTSTRTAKTLLNMIKARVTADNSGTQVPLPSDRTLLRYVMPLLEEAALTGTARERRSHSNRPKSTFRPVVAAYPGQFVEIDTNTVDAEVVMPDGTSLRPLMTTAIDLFTRTIVGFHVHAGAPSAHDHQILLVRMVMPRSSVPDLDPTSWLVNSKALPGPSMIAMGQAQAASRAMPFIAIETLTMDRGKDFLAARAAAESLGINVVDAPPHSPAKKPHVEKFFDFLNKGFCTYIDSYLGHSPDHRGRVPGTPIGFREFVDATERWIAEVYQNRPHSGLTSREHPGRSFSPNQMYSAAFDASAGIPLPLTVDDYVGFLPFEQRVIRADGVQFRNEIYDSDGLNGLRSSQEKRSVHFDPYEPERVWLKHPDTTEWIECVARSVRLSSLPFGRSVAASLAAMPVAEDPSDKWSQDFLAVENQRVAQAKADEQKSKRASKKATKAAAEKASRKQDSMPRPGPVVAPPLPPATPIRRHHDDYTIA